MDTSREIRRSVDTGKTVIGFKQTEKNILKGNGQLLIISNNIPKQQKEKLEHIAKIAGIPILEFNGTSKELGTICGKPFTITSMLVQDQGKSSILSASKKTK